MICKEYSCIHIPAKGWIICVARPYLIPWGIWMSKHGQGYEEKAQLDTARHANLHGITAWQRLHRKYELRTMAREI